MLRKIKFKISAILLIGFIIIIIGVCIGFLDYFESKKNKAFTEMNLMLYENEIPETIDSTSTETQVPDEEETKTEENSSFRYDYIGVLEIPKINLKGGFLDLYSPYNNVDYNITVIKGSTFPDQERSNLILAAHSGICPVCYFDSLYKLTAGDIAYVSYKGVKYTYKIVNIYEVEKTGTVKINRDYSKDGLVLITCTRNSNTKQTVYILDLINKE